MIQGLDRYGMYVYHIRIPCMYIMFVYHVCIAWMSTVDVNHISICTCMYLYVYV